LTSFLVQDLSLAPLKLLERRVHADERGEFSRIFCAEELSALGWQGPLVQVNHSRTMARAAVRGMHFQLPPHAEMKLVTCLRGEVWDVAVDIRENSPTFLKWHAEMLSAQNRRAMLIPQGFAHGFQALTDEAELLYCHSQAYAPQSEGGMNPLDPRLAITWPLEVGALSLRDAGQALLTDRFKGIRT